MNYTAATDPHRYGAAAAAAPPPHHHHHQSVHHHQQPQTLPQSYFPSYNYYANPNPNPNSSPIPKHDHPVPSAADAGILRPPGVDPYVPDPYAPHGGYEGHHVSAYAYPPSAAAAPAATTTSYYHNAVGGGEGQYGVHPFAYGATRNDVGSQTTSKDLETKKRKLIEGGTAAASVRVCSICNVVCNSDMVFASHLAGEKHALKFLGRSSNGLMPVVPPTHMKLQKAKSVRMKGSKKTAKVIHSVYCEVCKLECNSQDVLNTHKQGKKHKKNLQKLQESITAKSTSAPTMTAVKDAPVADKVKTAGEEVKIKAAPATEEDLETKKRKMLDGGAAADDVRVCSICNVVCNSQTVFDSHIAGQKHAAMVKKQQPVPVS